MATGRAIFQAHVDSAFPEPITLDLQWTFTATPFSVQTAATLSSGDNTLTIPAGTKLIAVVPPVNNAATLKFGTGGSQWTMQPNMPFLVTWSSGTVTINASAPVTGVTIAFF